MYNSNNITLCFPESFSFDDVMFTTLQKRNKEYKLSLTDEKRLIIAEKDFAFIDTSYLEFRLPTNITEIQLDEFNDVNQALQYNSNVRPVSFEWNGNDLIYVKMGTFGIISAITVAIISGLYAWSTKNKKGRVYSEEGEYRLSNSDKTERRKPDVSFISYKNVSEEKQDEWTNSFITSPPTLVIEVVSSKAGLKKEFEKMKTFWMPSGAHIGVVVCPFSKKYYIFEPGKRRRSKDIYKTFIHPLLEGYEGDFSTYVDKVK